MEGPHATPRADGTIIRQFPLFSEINLGMPASRLRFCAPFGCASSTGAGCLILARSVRKDGIPQKHRARDFRSGSRVAQRFTAAITGTFSASALSRRGNTSFKIDTTVNCRGATLVDVAPGFVTMNPYAG